jgi:hypothetical protein
MTLWLSSYRKSRLAKEVYNKIGGYTTRKTPYPPIKSRKRFTSPKPIEKWLGLDYTGIVDSRHKGCGNPQEVLQFTTVLFREIKFHDTLARFSSCLHKDCRKEHDMDLTVAQMSRDELKEIIAVTIEQKLLEMLGDPDEGLEIRKSVHERLVRQKKAVAAGERGEPFEDVVRRLGLE